MEEERARIATAEQQLHGMPAVPAQEPMKHRADGRYAGARGKKDGVFIELPQHKPALRWRKADLLACSQFIQAFRRRSLPAGFNA